MNKTTSAAEIFKEVYTNEVCDQSKARQMQEVINYFTKRGFNIRRVLNPETNNKTFYWYLTWN